MVVVLSSAAAWRWWDAVEIWTYFDESRQEFPDILHVEWVLGSAWLYFPVPPGQLGGWSVVQDVREASREAGLEGKERPVGLEIMSLDDY